MGFSHQEDKPKEGGVARLLIRFRFEGLTFALAGSMRVDVCSRKGQDAHGTMKNDVASRIEREVACKQARTVAGLHDA